MLQQKDSFQAIRGGATMQASLSPVSAEDYLAATAPQQLISDATQAALQSGQPAPTVVKSSYATSGGSTKTILRIPVSSGKHRAEISPIINEYRGGGGAIVATPKTKTTISQGVLDLMKRRGVV